ncbi:hypothetical protein ACOMCU_27405 [Lysinibacillus sp. UGB7]|uniref:hypothetical protein n=1 Tax=Lysinibacillus sp. UGB7 TaxID=3411039 RepID=UPI003B7C1AC8
MLKALRDGIESEISKYEDITPIDLSGFLQQRQSKIDVRGSIQRKKEEQENQKRQFEVSHLEKAVHSLITLGVDAKQAEIVVKRIINNAEYESPADITIQALTYLKDKQGSKVIKKKDTKAENNLLEKIIKRGKSEKKSAYEALLEDGFIKLPIDELII